MTSADFETKPRPEYLTTRNLLEVDPAELMRDNPAALIVNQTMYQRISAGGFNPRRCGQPQVARVKTYSPEHGEVIRLFIIDGLTRTKYVNDHLGEIQRENPEWKFQVEDFTEELIKDTTIVFPHERQAGQQELTMVQYLRAIVEPTKVHAQIAPNRIAAHLINGWKVMVGQELAEKFSATAALSFLTETTINENMLRSELRDRKLVVGIDDEAGERLCQALVDMASVIRGAGLDQREVTKSAFLLLSTLSPVIGGERRTREEIYGLLYSPEVERKLLQAFSDKADRELMRAQLDKILQQLIKDYVGKLEGVIIIRETLKALKDENIEFHHFRDIVMSDNPAKRYEQITRQINQDRFTNVYLRTLDKVALTGFELVLIEQLEGRLADVRNALNPVTAIYEASNVLQQVVDFSNQLTGQRGELLKSGVSVKLLDEAVASINNLQAGLLAAQSIQAVSNRTDAIIKEIVKTRKDISTQQRGRTITSRIDEISGEDLRTSFGNLKRAQLVAWIFREFVNADEVTELEVSHRLEQLKQLRSEFQREVVETGMRIAVALQRQRERRIIQPASEERKIEEDIAPSRSVESEAEVDPRPEALSDDIFILPVEGADAFRRRVNVERLAQVSDLALRVFGMLDLDINEVPRQEVEQSDEAFRMWGRFRYKHPDVDRLITDALAEQQKRIRLLEAQIALDREQTDKDTRTGR